MNIPLREGEVLVRPLRDFPYYERINAAGVEIPLRREDAQLFERLGFVEIVHEVQPISERSS